MDGQSLAVAMPRRNTGFAANALPVARPRGQEGETPMAQLTQPQIKKIIDTVLKTEPYKTEFNNPYFRSITRKMLAEVISLTQLAIEKEAPNAD